MATTARNAHHEYAGDDLIDAARGALTLAGEQWTGMREAVFTELARHDR
jgi:Fur family transcriptional regulator, zinc uptake regulator